MAQSKKFLIVFISIILLLCIVFIYKGKESIPNSGHDTIYETQTGSELVEEPIIQPTYTESDTDLNYNYITNADSFKKVLSDCPYLFLQSIGSKLNSFLQAENYYKRQLTFTSIDKKGTYIHFNISISDSNDIVIGSYEWGLDEWEFFIEVDGNN